MSRLNKSRKSRLPLPALSLLLGFALVGCDSFVLYDELNTSISREGSTSHGSRPVAVELLKGSL